MIAAGSAPATVKGWSGVPGIGWCTGAAGLTGAGRCAAALTGAGRCALPAAEPAAAEPAAAEPALLASGSAAPRRRRPGLLLRPMQRQRSTFWQDQALACLSQNVYRG